MTLKDGTKWRHPQTQEAWNLYEDYDGRWYLARRDEKGVHKTLSYSAPVVEMMIEGWPKVNEPA